MLPLIKEELKSHQGAIACYICRKRILQKHTKNKNYQNVRDHCYYTWKSRSASHSICNLKLNVPNKIPIVEGKFECFGENTEKYRTFYIPIKRVVTKIDKDDDESVVTISYKITFIDNARFIATSLSNLVDNFT